ncbi:MAG: glycosyltransferase family 2 protein [Parvibaculaceae bacterium]
MRISVITPAFNAARTIEETIASVLGQERPPDEILLVDDGSTDDTARRAARLSPLVRVLSQANLGPPAAVNHGIREATGTHLAFIDADDLWPADKLARQDAAFAEDPTLAGVFGLMESFACPSATAQERRQWHIPSGAQPGWLLGTLLVQRPVFDAIGLFDESFRIGAAIDWIARLRERDLRLRMLDAVLLRRRVHAGSLSQRSDQRDKGYLKLIKARLQERRNK